MNKLLQIFLTIGFTFNSQLAFAVSCGDYISSDTTLTEDLHCTSGFAALNVISDNVIINLNGHKISGNPSLAGILIFDVSNISIINGSILDFYSGINASQANNITVDNLTFFDTGHAITFHHVNNSSVVNSDFIHTRSVAIKIYNTSVLDTSKGNSVKDNEFYNTNGGIQLCGAGTTQNYLANNLIIKSQDYSVHLISSSENQITNNQILDSTLAALKLNYASYNEITSNYLKNGSIGIALQAAGGHGSCEAASNLVSKKNSFGQNSIFEFDTGVIFGLGLSKTPNVYSNEMYLDKIYDNQLGAHFSNDSSNNNLIKAVFSRNLNDVVDHGISNTY